MIRQIITILFMALAVPAFSGPLKANDSIQGRQTGATPITISLLTCGPGPVFYELEGHTGIRIRTSDSDMVANWGLFDFNAPNFVYRYVKGETDYCVGIAPFDMFMRQYIAQRRNVTEQVLNLNQTQAERVAKLIEENLQPANRIYRYNYVKDNCATRPLEILRKAIGDTITLAEPAAEIAREATFRSIMRHFHRNYPWYQFGIDLALGSGIDYPITKDEMAFAPVVLEQMMAFAAIDGQPLVRETIVLNRGDNPVLPPTPWYATPIACACYLLLITMGLTWFDVYRHQLSSLFDFLLFLIFGLAGCVTTYLVFISVHEATSPNWLLLWLNPLCLLVPAFVWLKKLKGVLICYHFANFAALLGLGIIWCFVDQSGNIAFIPLIIADAMRSACYLYVTRCNRKKKNRYQIGYYTRSSFRW